MGIDSRGVLRGQCTRCECTDFTKTSVKCRCGHPPTFHVDLSTSSSSQHSVNVSGSPIDKPSYSKAVGNSAPSVLYVTHLNQSLHDCDGIQHCCYNCSTMYLASVGACPHCYPRDNCENTSCNNMKYFDSAYGPFLYCSPACRDQHLLPGYNKQLREHIESVTKQDIKVEGYFSGSEPTTNVGMVFSNDDQQLLSKYNTDKDPNMSEAFRAGSLLDNGTVASKDLVTGTLPSTTLLPLMDDPENLVFIKSMPKEFSSVCFYDDCCSEDGKYGLYVTGLKLGEETELELGDLIICDASGMNFGQFTGFSTMITLAKGSPQVKVFRKHDMKTLRNTINKTVKNKSKGITVFLLPKQDMHTYSIKSDEVLNAVTVSSVDDKSIAQHSGIREGDNIQFIGVLKDCTSEFTLTQVTTVGQVITTCAELKTSPAIGLILIIKRDN